LSVLGEILIQVSKVPKVKELRTILREQASPRPVHHCRPFGTCPLPYMAGEAGGTARQIRLRRSGNM